MGYNSLKKDLVSAYHMLAMLKMDDGIYSHLSVRCPDQDAFLTAPFGMFFDEIKQDDLITMGFDGQTKYPSPNPTQHVIHGSLYEKRPDIQAIFHLHTPSITAVSSLKSGLLMQTQWALYFYEKIAYHPYDALALDPQTQGQKMVDDMGGHFILMMCNHGVVIGGRSIQEAFYYAYFLEKACHAQLLIGNAPTHSLPHDICQSACRGILETENPIGGQTWEAMLRKIP